MFEDRLIARMPHDPLSESLGIQDEVSGEGRVTARVRLAPAHRNALGAVHGALLFAMADTAMGRALGTVLSARDRCATVSATIQFLEPAAGDGLVAVGSIVRVGGKLAATHCDVSTSDGTLCAVAGATFYVSRPPEDA